MVTPHKTEITVEEALLKYGKDLPEDVLSVQKKVTEDNELDIKKNKKKKGGE